MRSLHSTPSEQPPHDTSGRRKVIRLRARMLVRVAARARRIVLHVAIGSAYDLLDHKLICSCDGPESHMMTSATAAVVFLASLIYAPAAQLEVRSGVHAVSETRINQARGTLPASAKQIELSKPRKGAPEAARSNGEGSIAPTAPVTCNQQNASSPACYSATQQARPIAR